MDRVYRLSVLKLIYPSISIRIILVMIMPEKEREGAREVLSNVEEVNIRRSGTSDVLTVPQSFRKSFPQLKGDIVFNAYLVREGKQILLIFEKQENDVPERR